MGSLANMRKRSLSSANLRQHIKIPKYCAALPNAPASWNISISDKTHLISLKNIYVGRRDFSFFFLRNFRQIYDKQIRYLRQKLRIFILMPDRLLHSSSFWTDESYSHANGRNSFRYCFTVIHTYIPTDARIKRYLIFIFYYLICYC